VIKILYLTIMGHRPNRANPNGQVAGWKAISNTLAPTYGDSLGINEADGRSHNIPDRPRFGLRIRR
jgi:hypothetical protein